VCWPLVPKFGGLEVVCWPLVPKFGGLEVVCWPLVPKFGGLEVACWPLVPKFAGSHQAEAAGFLGRKNPQHAVLRRRIKAVVV